MAKLDKNTALKLSEPVEEAYLACVDRLIVNIAKHLGSGTAIRTGAWETRMLAELGQLTAENAKIINEATRRVPQEIRTALSEASKLALADVERSIEAAIERGDIERAPTDSVTGMLDDLAGQAIEQANLVNTVMLDSGQSAYLQAVNNTVSWINQTLDRDTAQSVMNEAATATALNTETRQQALKKAIAQMADQGIYGFVDRAGRHWAPEAYINMDIRTTVHNAAIQSIRTRQEDYGSDIFQISSHPAARPLCYPYQGKFYSWQSGAGTFTDGMGAQHTYAPITDTSYGQPAGIFGINCGHYPLPQIPHVTIPQDEPEQNKEENDKEYLETQRQRALEREVRNAKRKAAAFDVAGLKDAFAEEAVRVKEKQQAYREFCKQTGRRERLDRLGVAGYTRSVSNKAMTVARRRKAEDQLLNEIMATGALPKTASIHLHPLPIDISELSFDGPHIAERRHDVTEKEAKLFIQNAVLSASVWNGRFERYYSFEGAAYVNVREQIIRTAFPLTEYDEKTKALMEVLKGAKTK